MIGSISWAMPDSRSRTSCRRFMIMRRVSRFSSGRSSLFCITRMYSVRSSSSMRAFLCRLLLKVTFHWAHSCFRDPFRCFVLSVSAPML